MSFKTAACHRYRIMDKVGASNTADLVRRTLTSPTGGDSAFDDVIAVGTAWCESSLRSRLLLAAELARAKKLQQECRDTVEHLRFLNESFTRQCEKLAELMATRKPAGSACLAAPTAAA
jgi:hypothetical protein